MISIDERTVVWMMGDQRYEKRIACPVFSGKEVTPTLKLQLPRVEVIGATCNKPIGIGYLTKY